MNMQGKTVIITGCTSGIGRATAEKISATGAKVIMACRNVERAEKVREEISRMTNNEKIVVALLKSIREFSERVNKEEDRLDDTLTFGRRKSEDGLELTMATNHFGPFLITLLLIGRLAMTSGDFQRLPNNFQSQRADVSQIWTDFELCSFEIAAPLETETLDSFVIASFLNRISISFIILPQRREKNWELSEKLRSNSGLLIPGFEEKPLFFHIL